MANSVLDFFICHNKADESWAKWLDWYLRNAGFNTFVPDWDIQPGQNEILAIDQALKDAKKQDHQRKVIIILSGNLRTDSIQENYWTALFSTQQQSLIPIKIDKTDCGSIFLAGLKAIDLSDADEATSLKQLDQLIFSVNPRSADKPQFPGQNLAPLFPKLSQINEQLPAQPNTTTKLSKKINPVYVAAQLNRSEQAEEFIEQLKNNNETMSGKTLGFIACGPSQEWPTALQYKFCQIISKELLYEDDKYPTSKPLQAEKNLSDKTAKRRLLSLFKEFYGVKEKSINEAIIKERLEQTRPSHIFSYELLSDEISDHDFILELLSAWQAIQLEANSASHILLLICEVEQIAPQKKKWWPFGKPALSWQEKMQMAIHAKKIAEPLLLPPLDSPDWGDIEDWLKVHFVADEDLREQIKSSLKHAFPHASAIPHRELKNKLLPYFQTQ